MKYEKIEVNGSELTCPICGCSIFAQKKFLLNTTGMSFLNLDWANNEANCYICKDCGYILWFAE